MNTEGTLDKKIRGVVNGGKREYKKIRGYGKQGNKEIQKRNENTMVARSKKRNVVGFDFGTKCGVRGRGTGGE